MFTSTKAPKGSGKTTLLANLLDFYKGYFHAITVISPTIASDEKWDYVKRQPLLAENKALKRFMAKKNPPNAVVERTVVDESKKRFDPHVPEDCFMTEFDENTLGKMVEEQMEMIETLKSLGGTKFLANRWLLILDDLVGSALFNNRKENVFKAFNTRHRHASCSIIMVSQAYKEIQKTVRTNFTAVIAFEIGSEGELDSLYNEYSMGYKRETWDQLYHHCVAEPYAFMYMNVFHPREQRVMKNFDQFCYLKEDGRGQDGLPDEQPKSVPRKRKRLK